MSSNSPCAVYNFYNCCDPSTASQPASFLWHSGNVLEPHSLTGGQEFLSSMGPVNNWADTDLKNYMGLTPLHRNARLIEISLIKFPNVVITGSPYTATVIFNLVVLDYNGLVIKTISTAPINYQSTALRTWIPISLSTVPGDLDIPAGQLVAGELTFGAAFASGQSSFLVYQLSGTGMLL